MKKLFIFITIITSLSMGGSLSANSIGEKLLLYIPNRIADITDIFSVSIGFGGTARAELMATELVKVGGGYDIGSFRMMKEYNRQYGFALEDGWNWAMISAGEESSSRHNSIGWVDEYYEASAGVPLPNMPIYNYYTGSRDFWQIGGALGFLVEAEVYINPIEWADLALGFILIDLRQDDFELVDFQ